MKIFFKATLVFHCLVLLAFVLSSCATMRHRPDLEQAQTDYMEHNYPRAYQELWDPAKKNDPRALYAMGYMCYYGIGTDKDQDLGRSLIRRAAAKNYPPAVTALKLITQRRHEQYTPLESYSAVDHEEGLEDIQTPLIRKDR